jgi:hypothetical protein
MRVLCFESGIRCAIEQCAGRELGLCQDCGSIETYVILITGMNEGTVIRIRIVSHQEGCRTARETEVRDLLLSF